MRLDARTIKQTIPIEQVIGADHPIKQKNNRLWVGDDETCNSLQIESDKQLFSWWSKDWHGDVFTYLMESRGIGFREALDILSRYSNEFPDMPPAKAFKALDEKPRPPINGDLVKRFESNLYQSERAIGYLVGRGLGTNDVKPYHVGYEKNYNGTDILTIPVIEGGAVKTIRFRRMEDPTRGLINSDGEKLPKYGYMFSGYGAQLYNADTLNDAPDEVFIVEGELKAIVLESYGIRAVGLMGVSSMKTEWFERFKKIRRVIVALDPDQRPFEVKWVNRMATTHKNIRVLQLTDKIDDMILAGGVDIVRRAAESARKVIPVEERIVRRT